ncbi:ribosomal RNA processing protein 36 homolog [Engystomops pustulosus]|uniref:ribosomal RNA processing protein 36 homolog n=1 Tax=Engystomops pustulosus TaxID=76066 RepID=UPI003AFA0199
MDKKRLRTELMTPVTDSSDDSSAEEEPGETPSGSNRMRGDVSKMKKTPLRTDLMSPVTDSSDDSSDEDSDETESETGAGLEDESGEEEGTGGSSMSFEELLRVRNQMGTKAFNKARKDPKKGNLSGARVVADKNRPLEMSSKLPVPFLRKVVPFKKTVLRDPRFDDLSGEFKPEIFHKTYGFIDDIKKNEKKILEKKLKKMRNPEAKQRVQQLLRRMDQQEKASQKKQRLWEQQLEFKRQQREQAQQGKKPFYLKKGDVRKLELADKYLELKKKGKVESFLSKKRKRNATKDRRRLPNQQ